MIRGSKQRPSSLLSILQPTFLTWWTCSRAPMQAVRNLFPPVTNGSSMKAVRRISETLLSIHMTLHNTDESFGSPLNLNACRNKHIECTNINGVQLSHQSLSQISLGSFIVCRACNTPCPDNIRFCQQPEGWHQVVLSTEKRLKFKQWWGWRPKFGGLDHWAAGPFSQAACALLGTPPTGLWLWQWCRRSLPSQNTYLFPYVTKFIIQCSYTIYPSFWSFNLHLDLLNHVLHLLLTGWLWRAFSIHTHYRNMPETLQSLNP